MENKKRLNLLRILALITTMVFLLILTIALFTSFEGIYFILLGASLSSVFLTWGIYFIMKAK